MSTDAKHSRAVSSAKLTVKKTETELDLSNDMKNIPFSVLGRNYQQRKTHGIRLPYKTIDDLSPLPAHKNDLLPISPHKSEKSKDSRITSNAGYNNQSSPPLASHQTVLLHRAVGASAMSSGFPPLSTSIRSCLHTAPNVPRPSSMPALAAYYNNAIKPRSDPKSSTIALQKALANIKHPSISTDPVFKVRKWLSTLDVKSVPE